MTELATSLPLEELTVTPEVVSNFNVYQKVLEPSNAVSPQNLGLGISEYANALADPDVVHTYISDELGTVSPIPHLSPLHVYDWLNEEHYEQQFPDEASSGTLRHLLNLPNLDPSGEVRMALQDLAAKEGVLLFDFPERDIEAVDRVEQLLREQGIEHEQFQELGTQTYYAGKVHLKRTGYNPDQPILGLREAFEKMLADGTLNPSALLEGASYQSTVCEAQAEHMRVLYEKAFAVLNNHPCRQGIDDVEFRRLMVEDAEVAKLVCNVVVGENGETFAQVATVCLLGDDLGKYPWLNVDFYKHEIPAEHDRKQILYFPAIATDPEHQGEHKTAEVVNLIARMVEYGNNEIVVAFDCCDFNKDVFPLAEILEQLINATPEASIKFEIIGMQRYMAVKLKSPK